MLPLCACVWSSHWASREICLWCLGLHKPSDFLRPPPHAPIPPLQIPVLCMGVCVHVSVCVPARVCWHFPCIPPREETEAERKVFPRSLWRSQICHVCSTFSFFFNTSSKKILPFLYTLCLFFFFLVSYCVRWSWSVLSFCEMLGAVLSASLCL